MAKSGKEAGNGGQETVVLRHASGATAQVYLFGATLTSYKTADGKERIFCSPASLFDGKKAIRGGIPLVFPQFGQPDKAMPQHGVARTSLWAVDEVADSEGSSTAVLSLGDNDGTRAQWDHAFRLVYRVVLTAVSLTVTLQVKNTGDAPFSFNCLLHTYLAVPDIEHTVVCGLTGRQFIDKVADGEVKTESNAEVALPSFTDRVYIGTTPMSKDVTVKDSAGEGRAVCAIVNEASVAGAPQPVDVVLWNPYEGASPGDLPPPAFKTFVCVEPGLVSKMHDLAPGAQAELSQKLLPL